MRKLLKTLTIAFAIATFGLAGASSAQAVDADPSILEALALVPGGQIIDANTAYWPDQEMTLTVLNERTRDAIGNCPKGSVCAFSASTLGGKRLSWTSCGSYSPAALNAPVRSIADAKNTGRFEARNGSIILATAYAQSWDNVSGTTTSLVCH